MEIEPTENEFNDEENELIYQWNSVKRLLFVTYNKRASTVNMA
jgi:hypothetical protein